MTEKKWNGHVTLQQVYEMVERDYQDQDDKISALKETFPDSSLLPLGTLAQSFTGLNAMHLEKTDAVEQIYIGWLAKLIYTENNVENLIFIFSRLRIKVSTYYSIDESSGKKKSGIQISCDNFTALVSTSLPEIASLFFSALLETINKWKSIQELKVITKKFEKSSNTDIATAFDLLSQQINRSINSIGLHIEFQFSRSEINNNQVVAAQFRLVELKEEKKTNTAADNRLEDHRQNQHIG